MLRFIFSLLILPFITSCSWFFQESKLGRYPTSLKRSENTQQCKSIPSDRFTVDSFINEIQTKGNIKKVEDALCLIPRDIRSNYVLVHSSRSAQGSRPEAPRAILFKSKKVNGVNQLEYAISFNGNAEDTNFYNIEVVKANPRAKGEAQHFEYIDIEFDEDGKRAPHVSDSNPQQCMMCHGVNTNRARAIWDAKGFTPTVYGASTFGGSIGDEKYIEEFKDFLKRAPSDSRYSFLEDLDRIKIEGKRVLNQETANSTFAEALGTVNNRRIVQLIRETPDYEHYRYAILASLLECPQITQFVPQKLHGDHGSLLKVDPAFRDLKDEQKVIDGYKKYADQFKTPTMFTSMDWIRTNVEDNGEANMDPMLLPYFHDIEAKAVQWVSTAGMPIVNLRWLVEGRGLDMQEWAMDVPQSGNFGFYRLLNSRYIDGAPVGDQNSDNIRIAQFLIESDSNLRLAYANSGAGVGIGSAMKMFRNGDINSPIFDENKKQKVCQTLKKKSYEALNRLSPHIENKKQSTPSVTH